MHFGNFAKSYLGDKEKAKNAKNYKLHCCINIKKGSCRLASGNFLIKGR